MRKLALALPALLAITGCGESNTAAESATPTVETSKEMTEQVMPPIAKKVDHEMTIHGSTRNDQYYWMRDDNRTDPEILAHLQAEEDYTQASMKHTKDFQENVFTELTERLKKDDSSVPVLDNGFWYQSRFEEGKEYRIYARKADTDGASEEVLLDVNQLAEGKDYFAIGNWSVSTNNQIMAYSDDTVSRRVYTIRFKDLATGELFTDTLEGTNGGITWANDNKTVFYIKKDPQTLLGDRVYRHTLGTSQDDDVLVYQEKDTSFYMGVGKSSDKKYIAIYHSSTMVKGLSIIDADTPDAEFKPLHALEANHEYSADSRAGEFFIRTNWQAQNFRLMKASAADASDKSKWVDVIPQREDVYLDSFKVFKDHLVVRERSKGQMQLRIIDLNTNQSKTMAFDDEIFVAGFSNNPVADTSTLRVYYSSMTTPMSVYDIDMNTLEKTLLKRDEVIGDFDPANYQSERIYITARDGVEVPVSLVYRKDKFKKDGTNPLLQYGYGSYGATMDPFFSGSKLTLLDRGFVHATAHVRGGQLLGRQWYEDGKLLNKINTFNDFVDVTKALVKEKYGAEDKIFAAGGSAGGLLMGAVINQAPELYLGVTAAVPFVDVVTTMLDESIPLTTNEYGEWGNPNEKAYYDYMLSYSPYDQVEAKDYPNLLVLTGLHDSQVQYFEPAKWVAKLRDMKTDDNRLFFHVNMEAGHGGSSGRFRRYHEKALEYVFYFDLLGMTE